MRRLTDIQLLLVDCQTTGATPSHGQIIELGWSRFRAADPLPDLEATESLGRLVALPDEETVPRRVGRLTGITDEMLVGADPIAAVWDGFCRAAAEADQLAAHYARFEQKFLRAAGEAHGGVDAPDELLCTHAIATRLYPGLPRRGLRALAGFFGHPVDQPNRAGAHVRATAAIWQRLVAELDDRLDITTLDALGDWLDRPTETTDGATYAIDRDRRLALPDEPGVYRLLGADDRVLYVGKATSLRSRVNQYFQTRRGLSNRKLELVTQVHDVAVRPTATPLEAALLESDRIKEHAPPYNRALKLGGRSLDRSEHELPARPAPLPGPLVTILASSSTFARLVDERDAAEVDAGLGSFTDAHGIDRTTTDDDLARLGLDLWMKRLAVKERDEQEEADDTDEERPVPDILASILRRAAARRRRARWLDRLTGAALAWRPDIWPADTDTWRFVGLADAEIDEVATLEDAPAARRRVLAWSTTAPPVETVADYDRLRVLTTELRRLIRQERPVVLRTADGTVFERLGLQTCLELV